MFNLNDYLESRSLKKTLIEDIRNGKISKISDLNSYEKIEYLTEADYRNIIDRLKSGVRSFLGKKEISDYYDEISRLYGKKFKYVKNKEKTQKIDEKIKDLEKKIEEILKKEKPDPGDKETPKAEEKKEVPKPEKKKETPKPEKKKETPKPEKKKETPNPEKKKETPKPEKKKTPKPEEISKKVEELPTSKFISSAEKKLETPEDDNGEGVDNSNHLYIQFSSAYTPSEKEAIKKYGKEELKYTDKEIEKAIDMLDKEYYEKNPEEKKGKQKPVISKKVEELPTSKFISSTEEKITGLEKEQQEQIVNKKEDSINIDIPEESKKEQTEEDTDEEEVTDEDFLESLELPEESGESEEDEETIEYNREEIEKNEDLYKREMYNL
jgi:hypothetical protein